MSHLPDAAPAADVPSQPGWYADAAGAWWWWDGAAWTAAPAAAPAPAAPTPEEALGRQRSTERTTALVMWIVLVVGGGWLAALIFYLVSKEKAFVRHHAAEALNLTIVLIVPQVASFALLVPDYLSFVRDTLDAEVGTSVGFSPSGLFWLGLALLAVTTLITYAVSITGAVMAQRGRWWRIPLPFHPVRGVVRPGEEPYSVGGG